MDEEFRKYKNKFVDTILRLFLHNYYHFANRKTLSLLTGASPKSQGTDQSL